MRPAALSAIFGSGLWLAQGKAHDRQAEMLSPLLMAAQSRGLPHVQWAGQAALHRLGDGRVALEPFARHLCADIMMRLLVSRPVEDGEVDELQALVKVCEAAAPGLSLACPPKVEALPERVQDAARVMRKSMARTVARHRRAWVKGRGRAI